MKRSLTQIAQRQVDYFAADPKLATYRKDAETLRDYFRDIEFPVDRGLGSSFSKDDVSLGGDGIGLGFGGGNGGRTSEDAEDFDVDGLLKAIEKRIA